MLGLEHPLLALEEFLSVSQMIARERDMHKQLNIIASAARRMMSAEACCVYVLDTTQQFLLPEVVQGKVLSGITKSKQPVPLSNAKTGHLANICSYCAITGQLVNVADVYQYSGFDFGDFYEQDRASGLKTGSVLAVPLTDKEGISVGVLLMANRCVSEDIGIEAFPPEIETLVRGFAAQAAISVSNSKLINKNEQLLKRLEKLNASLLTENKELKGQLFSSLNLDQVIGRCDAMQKVFGLIEKVSKSRATIFLSGETGTGKELIAATIHKNSPVANGRFVAQNCAAFPPDLLESEMFGYQKGAFSGANATKKGLFEHAHQGTLFLDEVGEMPMTLQSKLLRALQEGEIRPVGGLQNVKVNVRVIAATNRSLEKMVKDGTFREDLYYRLNVFPIHLPPIRERKADLPALLKYFLDKSAKQNGFKIKAIAPEAMDALNLYTFPGNVRELQNIVERAVLLAGEGGVITFDCLPPVVREESVVPTEGTDLLINQSGKLKEWVEKFEAGVIRQKLKENSGNQTVTAEQLGLSRRTLVDKLGKYKLRHMDMKVY